MANNKHVIFKTLKITAKCNRLFIPFVLLSSLLLTSLTIVSSFVVSIILDVIINSSEVVLAEVMKKVLILLVITLALGICYKIIDNSLSVIKLKTVENFKRILGQKLTKIKYSYLDDPSFIEIKEQANFAIDGQSALQTTIARLSSILQESLTLIILLTMLFLLEPLIIVVTLCCFLLHLFFLFMAHKTEINLFENIIPINRKFGYYFDLIYSKEAAKDFRLYDIGEETYKNFALYSDKSANLFLRSFTKLGLFQTLDSVGKVLSTAVTYIIVTYKTLVNKLHISNFTFQITAATNVLNSLNNMSESIVTLRKYKMYLGNIISLFELEEETNVGHKELTKIEKIEFRNVSFTYPKTNIEILHNISFVINQNEKISIVGLNGAGKTTLIKLLCRLYDVVSGEILVNDINILDYDIVSYRAAIATIFQDYKLFNFSIKDNICLYENDINKLNNILEEIGIKNVVDKLDNNIYTTLGKDFDEDATELSGGEMQKLAIARALYKDSSLAIMDEPTSALDPKSEANIYENFNNLIKNKMTIYVSHRMSSSVFCDKILVIDNGRVSDFLPHKELMDKKDSLYYKLFMLQANNYKI